MFCLIPKRFDTPKWQAPVVPRSHAFVFSDGTSVSTLYELKQALCNLSDDVIYQHLSESRNDLANWVKDCMGDGDLAESLQSQTHRWGMIVAMERQMLRTLNLPSYVAKRWLSPAENPFIFVTGDRASSLEDLAKLIPNLSDETVSFHYERYPNDLSAWISAAIGDYEMADLLLETTNRVQMVNYLNDHLVMLAEAAKDD